MTVKPFTAEEMAFLAQVDALPNGIDLTPEQAAIVLQVDTDWLRKKRQGSEGAGPPFRTLGDGEKAPVRYPLGELRKWRDEKLYGNTRSARNKSTFRSFSAFMANAHLNDEWQFVEIDGRPVDALSIDAAEPAAIVTMTMDAYLGKVRASARNSWLEAEHRSLFDSSAEPQTEDKDRKLRSSQKEE
jgi:hypothetical protein